MSPARRRRLRGSAALVAVVAVVAAGAYLAVGFLRDNETLVRERCSAAAGGNSYELAPDQAANAALISGVAVRRGLPARAASIAVATAIQESKLRNIDYGDMDSLGLFQQRPSQGWGSAQQIMDPLYSTGRFYDALVKIDGYQDLSVTEAAQKVQKSAYPVAYADHEPEGRAFASALTGHSPAALSCVLRRTESPGSPDAVRAALTEVFGPLRLSEGTADLSVPVDSETAGWAVAHWAVANAKALNINGVEYNGLQWARGSDGWAEGSASSEGVVIRVASAD